MKRTHKNTRGFSLTELAIVIGVIGVIVGGLWVAVGLVSENVKQHELSQDITEVVGNVRAAYMNKQSMSGTTFNIMTILATNMKTVFPGDMTGGAGGMPSSPWGVGTNAIGTSSFNVCAWNSSCASPNCTCITALNLTAPLFAVEVENLPQSSCIVAAMGDSTSSMPQGLVDVFVNQVSVGPGATLPLPVTLTPAKTNCVNGNNTVDFVYRLNPSSAP